MWDEAFKEFIGGTLIPPILEGPDAEELREWGTYFPQFPSDILANTNYHAGAENANETVGWHVIHWMFHDDINPLIWDFIKDRPGRKY